MHRSLKWSAVAGIVALLALGGILFLPIGGNGEKEPVVTVSMVENAFVPAEIHAEPGQTLSITNDGAVVHSLLIGALGKGTELSPGQSFDLVLPDAAPGTYEVVCDIPGHRELGMVGTLVLG